MVKIYLEKLTDEKATYRYYPEGGEKYGMVSLMRKTGERIHEKPCPDTLTSYAFHALDRLEDYQKMGEFPEKGSVFWY